nr:MAG TPA: hypothetical protein [Caudoviricetes sp.]
MRSKRGSQPHCCICKCNKLNFRVIRCVGAGFNCNPAASGVRSPWVFGNLNDGGNDGLACHHSNNWVSNANWNGSLGATGTVMVSALQKIIAPYNPRLCAKIT